MGRVKAGSLKLNEASELLEISYRQTKRLWQRYREGGREALQHRSCGRQSTVSEWEEGWIGITYRGQRLLFHEIFRRREKPAARVEPPAMRKQHPQPAAHHPWRVSYKSAAPEFHARDTCVRKQHAN